MGFFRRLLSDKSSNAPNPSSTEPPANPPPSLPTPPPFQYTPLSSPTTHFRILHLQPTAADLATPWPSIPLRGTLLPCPVASPPAYHALSYCWGDPTPADTIVLDGAVLRITASCAAALRRMLRGKPRGRKIWVDAICINQAGDADALAERGAQVAMMDRIYDGAEEVVVHPGEGDDETDVACQAVRKLVMLCVGMMGPGFVAGRFRKKYEEYAVEVLKPTPEYPHGMLNGLFRQPWFQRYWVIQEVAFGDKVTFFCGEHRLLMKSIITATDFSRLSPTLLQSIPLATHWSSYTQFHKSIQDCVRQRENHATPSVAPPALYEVILSPSFLFDATRPEDKVHALYGICKRLGYDLPVPDYTKSLATVYTEAAQAILSYDGRQGLDKLLESVCATPSSRRQGIPSWVPDLSNCLRKWRTTDDANRFLNDRYNTCPSGRDHRDPGCVSGPGTTLRVKGRRLDIVCESGMPYVMDRTTNYSLGGTPTPNGEITVGVPSPNWSFIRPFLESLENWFAVVLRSTNATTASHAPAAGLRLAEVLAKDTKQSPSAENLKELARNLAVAMTIAKRHRDPDPLVLSETMGRQEYIEYQDCNMSMAMYVQLNATILGSIWKTVFRTAQGYVGVGPHSVKEGDIVVVFQGCSMAGLVRPTEGGNTYVGPAYVLGVMHGEFWEKGKAEDDEWFELV